MAYLDSTGLNTLWAKIKSTFVLKGSSELFSGNYNDLTNKPTIPAAQIQSDWNQTTTTAKDYIKNKPTIPADISQSFTTHANDKNLHLTSTLITTINGKQDAIVFNTNYDARSNRAATMSDISAALTSVLKYKGTIGSTGATVSDLPAEHSVGDVYVVATAGTYGNYACEVGDYIICKTSGTASSASDWNVVNGENQVESKDTTLSWNTLTEIAVVDGTSIKVKLPANPATDPAAISDETINALS